jgi:ABC-type oligopeptide transport system substrate-binding subunit
VKSVKEVSEGGDIMKHWLASLILLALLMGCSPQPAPAVEPSPIPATSTFTPIPPTATFTPSPLPPTATLTPSPTPLPGSLVLPIDTLGKTIPWLPTPSTGGTGVSFIGFNTLRPPFNSALVRQAFAYAIDRQVITDMAKKYKTSNPSPATTLTPPETLGRDLYNEVGTAFDPQKAKELLTEAGYTDPSAFPTVTIIVNASGEKSPGARFNMANAMAEMWKTHLGVSVEVEVIQRFNDYGNRLKTNPPEMFWLGWAADYNDPDNFLRGIFRSDSEYNYGYFANPEFDQLVDRAKTSGDPAKRQELYILAERLLCETDVALIPLYHSR